jgi:hypothetical protein
METQVTKADLWDVRDHLSGQQQQGFRGINARLDMLNGRLRKAEVAIARHDQRLQSLEADQQAAPGAPGTERRVSERDVRMVAIGAGTVASFIAIVFKALPALLKAIQ